MNDQTSMKEMISKGIRNPRAAYRYLPNAFSGVEAALFSRFPIGDNVLDEDWDVLVVLDTCRKDALETIKRSNDYQWLSDCDIESRFSVGGSTLEWTAQTFRESHREKAAKIDYVAGNILVEEVLAGRESPESIDNAGWSPTRWSTLSLSDLNDFVSVAGLRNVRESGPGHRDRPHPAAQLVTDLAIQHGREVEPDRMLVHYIQPHYPYYSVVEEGEREELRDWEQFPFPHLKRDEVDQTTVWNRYLKELKSGLDAVSTLLKNYDAEKVAITADHGEAFGERFALKRGYKHRVGMLHPKVRKVPWTVTSATDRGSRRPDIELKEDDTSRREKLEALGYL
jgi:hypothetical protein